MIAHGGRRTTRDIDLLVDDSPGNIARVKQGLRVLPDNAAADVDDMDVQRHVVVRVADEIVVDLMAAPAGSPTPMRCETLSRSRSSVRSFP